MAAATALPPSTSTRSCCGRPRGTAYLPLIDRRCRRTSTASTTASTDHLRQPEVGDEGAGMLPAALDGQQVGEVGDRQQQAGRVGQPHGGERERQRRQRELRGDGQRDRRQHHRGGVDAQGDRGDRGQRAVEREEERRVPAAGAGDEMRGDVEDLRVGAQVADEGDQQEEGEHRPGGGPRRDHGVDKHGDLSLSPCPPRSTAPAPPSAPAVSVIDARRRPQAQQRPDDEVPRGRARSRSRPRSRAEATGPARSSASCSASRTAAPARTS